MRHRAGVGKPRPATHVSDLLFCLKKAWAKKKLPDDYVEEIDDDTVLTWVGGLQFEELVSEGAKQAVMSYCRTCDAVGGAPGKETPYCVVCGQRWLIGTPDYIKDKIVHEVKQTRKSRNSSINTYWIEQLASYILFEKIAGREIAPYGRIVQNSLMGDYGKKSKDGPSRPPRSSLDVQKVILKGDDWMQQWKGELIRRQQIVEGEKEPPVNGMGDGDERSPAYLFECDDCEIGKLINCTNYPWKEEVEVEDGGGS